MSIQEYNCDVFQGDTLEISFPLLNFDGTPGTPIEGWAITSQVRDKEGGNNLCAEVDLTNGINYVQQSDGSYANRNLRRLLPSALVQQVDI